MKRNAENRGKEVAWMGARTRQHKICLSNANIKITKVVAEAIVDVQRQREKGCDRAHIIEDCDRAGDGIDTAMTGAGDFVWQQLVDVAFWLNGKKATRTIDPTR